MLTLLYQHNYPGMQCAEVDPENGAAGLGDPSPVEITPISDSSNAASITKNVSPESARETEAKAVESKAIPVSAVATPSVDAAAARIAVSEEAPMKSVVSKPVHEQRQLQLKEFAVDFSRSSSYMCCVSFYQIEILCCALTPLTHI